MKNLILFTALIFHTTPTFAQDKEGNGGGAIVCTDNEGNITEATLLDLREAEQDGLTIVRSDAPRETQLTDALKKLETVNPKLVSRMLDIQTHKIKPTAIERGKRLPPPSDTRLTRLNEPRRNCNLNGLGAYHDQTDILEYDPVIVEAMEKHNRTDLAAFDFHELAFKAERDGPALSKNSIKARKLTGAVFAKEPFNLIPPTQGIEKAKTVCTSEKGDYQFYLSALSDGEHRIQFTQFGVDTMMELTYADFKKESELTPKFNQGLIRNLRELRDSDRYPDERGKTALWRFFAGGHILWTKTYREVFTLQSSMSPDYFMALEVIDWTDPQSNQGIFKKKYWIENHGVRLILKRGSPQAIVALNCVDAR